MKEFKEFSKTKKKALLESIRIAKELYDAKYKNEHEEKSKISTNIKKSTEISSNFINSSITNNIQSNPNSSGLNNLSKEAAGKKETDKNIKNAIPPLNNNVINAPSKDNFSSNNNKNYNIKNKLSAINNNSELLNSNLSFNKDSNEINDLQLSEDISKEYELDVDKSLELNKKRNKEIKKRRLVVVSDRDSGKNKTGPSSLGKSKIRENFTKNKRRRRINEQNNCKIYFLFNFLFLAEYDCSDLMIKIINYLLYVSKNIETLNIDNNKECLFKVLDYLKDYKMENPIGYLKVIFLFINYSKLVLVL